MTLLTFIRRHIRQYVNAPTVRQCMDAAGYASSSHVMLDINWLVTRGDLVRTGAPGTSRSFTTTEARNALAALADLEPSDG